MGMIHKFLLNSEETSSEYLFKLLHQSNHLILKLITHKNAELKDDYYKMRCLILQSLGENNEDYSDLVT